MDMVELRANDFDWVWWKLLKRDKRRGGAGRLLWVAARRCSARFEGCKVLWSSTAILI